MDKLFNYIKEKKQNLRDDGGNKKTQQPVGFDITHDRSENLIQKIVDSAAKAKHYYSNANSSQQKVLYSGEHFFFRDKSHIFTVELVESAIRKYIAVFQRKSKCFFRLLETFWAVMRIFMLVYNEFGHSRLYFSS